MKRIQILPNLVTVGNAFCGFLAVVKTTRAIHESNPEFLAHAAWYIFLAMIFDALDGKVARMVKAASDFGSQLDSLCDAVSFGLAPAYLVYAIHTFFNSQIYPEKFLFLSSAIYVCCAILRLARFNVEVGVEEEDHRFFKGIPTPAAAGVLVSLVILLFNSQVIDRYGEAAVREAVLTALPWYTLGCSVLMVSSLRFMHVVSVVTTSKVRFEYLVLFVILIALIYVNPELSVFVVFQIYLLSGLLTTHLVKIRRPRRPPSDLSP